MVRLVCPFTGLIVTAPNEAAAARLLANGYTRADADADADASAEQPKPKPRRRRTVKSDKEQ